MSRQLAKRRRRATVIVATSGETGSAAIAALKGLDNVTVIVLHPNGRVSEVQRRQMTTVPDANIHNIALEGNVRRYPIDREILVRRYGICRAHIVDGGEFDQLRPHHGAMRLLFYRRRGLGRQREADLCRPHRKFRRRFS